MEITKAELAKRIGCSKGTVVNAINALSDDLSGHIVRRGKTDYLDEFAASAIASKLGSRFVSKADDEVGDDGQPEVTKADLYREAYERATEQIESVREACDEQIARYRALLAERDEQIAQLNGQIESRDRRIDRLTNELMMSKELQGFHWPWRRREILARYKALPAAEGDR